MSTGLHRAIIAASKRHRSTCTIGLIVLVAMFAIVPSALAAPAIRITSPAQGATVPGPSVRVAIEVTEARLVPAAQATKNEDLHVHYLMDVNPTPYLDGRTEIPTGDPNVVHSGEAAHTFEGLSPGAHSVTVILTTADHKAIQQVPAATARFTVAGARAGSGNLPRSGDMPALTWPVFGLLGVTLVSGGLALLWRARSGQD